MSRLMSAMVVASLSCAHAATAQSTANEDFCDTGFRQVDTDGDETVTELEWEASAEAMFDLLDDDDSSDISRAEFSNCYGRLAMRQSASVSDRSGDNLGEADGDGDGVITQAEFMQAGEDVRQGVEAGDSEAMAPEGAAATGSATQRGDGEASATPDLGPPSGGTGTKLDRFVDTPMAGGDDAEQMGAEEFAARASRTFNSLDSNQDEVLSQQEWSQTSAMRSDITQQLDRLFEELDADESEGVDREEYLADSRERFEAARAEAEGSGDDEGVPLFVYYRHQLGL